ncbi:MAG: hypothetical protein AABX05_02010 [Nanoarchaeota archaeon]
MSKIYYIENLNKYLKQIPADNHNPITPLGENIIEIDSTEKMELILNSIKSTDFVEDNLFKDFIETNFPLFSKYVGKTPIDLNVLKEELRDVFFEIPDEYFQEDNSVNVIKRIINFVIIKNETSFTLTNFLNGKLEYEDKKYWYSKTYLFYFRMMRLNYILPEFYAYTINMQKLMEKIFLKELIFSNRKEISRKDLEVIREIHNVIAKHLVDFKYALEKMNQQIEREQIHLKRTNVPIPENYWIEEKDLIAKTQMMVKGIEKEIANMTFRKDEIIKYIQEKKGMINKENVKTVLEILGIADWFSKLLP